MAADCGDRILASERAAASRRSLSHPARSGWRALAEWGSPTVPSISAAITRTHLSLSSSPLIRYSTSGCRNLPTADTDTDRGSIVLPAVCSLILSITFRTDPLRGQPSVLCRGLFNICPAFPQDWCAGVVCHALRRARDNGAFSNENVANDKELCLLSLDRVHPAQIIEGRVYLLPHMHNTNIWEFWILKKLTGSRESLNGTRGE